MPARSGGGLTMNNLSALAEPPVELAEPGIERTKLCFSTAGMSIRNSQPFREDGNSVLKKNQVASY